MQINHSNKVYVVQQKKAVSFSKPYNPLYVSSYCAFPSRFHLYIYKWMTFTVMDVMHVLFQASSIENKQDWIKHIREVIQERTVHLRGALKEPIHIPKATTAKHKGRR